MKIIYLYFIDYFRAFTEWIESISDNVLRKISLPVTK